MKFVKVMERHFGTQGREKCDRYWPYDTQPVYYGDIQVTILNESHYADWSISEFRVCRGESSRIIRHFHFTTWPDFGVPDPPTTLIRFVRCFRDRVPTDHKPIVVHCSAGVGRSGTFIALDRLLQQMTCQDFVDVFSVVYEMRRERVWMVQTEQQYICIHQCILAALQGFDYSDSTGNSLGSGGMNGASNGVGTGNAAHPMSMGGMGLHQPMSIHQREMHDNQGFEGNLHAVTRVLWPVLMKFWTVFCRRRRNRRIRNVKHTSYPLSRFRHPRNQCTLAEKWKYFPLFLIEFIARHLFYF